MMKIQIQYGTGVAVLPASVLDVMNRATAADLRVLLALCADAAMREQLDGGMEKLCARSGCTPAQAEASLAFWRGAGVLTVSEDGTSEPMPAPEEADIGETAALAQTDSPEPAPAPLRRPDSLPKYTTEELTALLEKRREAAAVIDECQRVLGKIFNTHEIGILVGLLDYLALEAEYLILLCAHCAKMGKKSLHYIEKVAFDKVDGGACDVASLQETLRREDAAREAEGKIRALFGAQDRKLSQTERKYIHRWTEEWHFDLMMIERAYEATVDSIGEASMRYTDGVLKRWQAEGLMTPEAVEASDEKWRQARESAPNAAAKNGKSEKGNKNNGGSFDVDDFFEAALRRSYQDM